MARRTARAPKADKVEEVASMDFDRAKKLYFEDIKPARSKASEHMQEVSTAFKAVKKVCGIQPGAMKAAIKLHEMEDSKRDNWLRAFNGYLRAVNIDPDPKDLVDAMNGEKQDRYARPKPTLVTLAAHEGDNEDLAGGADDDGEGDDAEEVVQEAPAAGTGAAAIAAMNAAKRAGDAPALN